MAKKSKKRAASKSKVARKPARSGKAKKAIKETRFIMVLEPALKAKMRAAAAKASKKVGGHVSMSAWARQVIIKAVR